MTLPSSLPQSSKLHLSLTNWLAFDLSLLYVYPFYCSGFQGESFLFNYILFTKSTFSIGMALRHTMTSILNIGMLLRHTVTIHPQYWDGVETYHDILFQYWMILRHTVISTLSTASLNLPSDYPACCLMLGVCFSSPLISWHHFLDPYFQACTYYDGVTLSFIHL